MTSPETDHAAEYASLPAFELGFPGELRDRLTAAVFAGEKTTTSCLYFEFDLDGEAVPRVGERAAMLDSAGRPVAVVELTETRVVPLGEVDRRHALDEGEGFAGVEEWRRAHEEFWHSAQYREAVGLPGFVVDDATLVFAQRFRVVADLRGAGAGGVGGDQ